MTGAARRARSSPRGRSQARRPRPRLERSRPRLTGRAALLLVAVAFLAMMAVVPVGRYLEQRAEIAELERRASELTSANAELREQIRLLHDPVELERLARACLGMVEPGEVALVIPGATPDC